MAAISYVVIGPCNTSTLHTAYRNANVDQMPDGLCERCLLYLNCMRLRLADMGHVMRPGRQEPVAAADISFPVIAPKREDCHSRCRSPFAQHEYVSFTWYPQEPEL